MSLPGACCLQVKLIFGYSRRPNPASTDILKLPPISFPRHDPVHLQLQDLLGPMWTPYFQWREFVMGAVWLIILFTMKEVGKRNKCGHRHPHARHPLLQISQKGSAHVSRALHILFEVSGSPCLPCSLAAWRLLSVGAAALQQVTAHSMSLLRPMISRRRLVYVRAAGPLTVTVLSIAICNIFKLYNAPHNIKIVGVIPSVRVASPLVSVP